MKNNFKILTYCATVFLCGVAPFIFAEETHTQSETDAVCHRTTLLEGPLEGMPGYRLGKVKNFTNDNTGAVCWPLYDQTNSHFEWIQLLHQKNGKSIVERCVKYSSDSCEPDSIPSNDICGGSQELFEEMLPHLNFKEFKMPAYSSPTFCNQYLSFWELKKDGTAVATVWDWTTRKKILSQKVGKIQSHFGTDVSDFFPFPHWDKSGKRVTFTSSLNDADDYQILEEGKREVTLTLPQ